MALGKNLKRKKLIEKDESSTSTEETKQKKTASAKKEELIKKPTKKKRSTSKKPKTVSQAKTKSATSQTKSTKPKAVPKKKIQQEHEQVVISISDEVEAASQIPPPSPELKPISDEQKKDQSAADQLRVGLPIFIAEEVHTLKKELRERYKSELESIKDKTIQFVIFEVGGESYAVEISVVKEVVPLPMLSKTPNTPDHIKGIANIRGATYTVYDLAEKFKVKGDQLAKFLLVIGKSEVPASLMIGSLPSTLKIKGSEVSGSMDMIEDATLDVSFIKGIIHHEQKLVYYLDVVELLKNDKAIIVPDKYLRRAE